MAGTKLTCQKCGKTMDEGQFYSYKDGRKTELCKACLTMHIDNYDPNTFLWLLEKMDVPYVPEEWNVLRDRAFAKDPKKMNGMSVFGKYLSKMKLKQWQQYHWSDTDRLQRERQAKIEEQQRQYELAGEELERDLKEKLEAGLITEAEYKTLMPTPVQYQDYVEDTGPAPIPTYADDAFNQPGFNEDNFLKESELPDPGARLTQEDKIMLAVKWGRLYKPNEWIELEKMYQEMEQSFDIQDADTRNSLIFICKLSLKANQALDSGDYESFQRLSKTLNDQRKAANFTAAQRRREDKHDFVDSVGELVAYCEKYGGAIPKYEITQNLDIIDKVIQDMKDYNKTLIYEDTALARQIEDYLKKREVVDAKKSGAADRALTDQDYADYEQSVREQQEADEALTRSKLEDVEDES